jgi:hypothetical protein
MTSDVCAENPCVVDDWPRPGAAQVKCAGNQQGVCVRDVMINDPRWEPTSVGFLPFDPHLSSITKNIHHTNR